MSMARAKAVLCFLAVSLFLYLTFITAGQPVSHIQLDIDNGIESARWSSQRSKWYKDRAPTLEYWLSLIHRVGSSAQAAITAVNPPKPAAASGLVHGVLEGQDEDGEDEDEDDNKVEADLNVGDQPKNG